MPHQFSYRLLHFLSRFVIETKTNTCDRNPGISISKNGTVSLSFCGDLVLQAGRESDEQRTGGVKILDSPLITSWHQLKV